MAIDSKVAFANRALELGITEAEIDPLNLSYLSWPCQLFREKPFERLRWQRHQTEPHHRLSLPRGNGQDCEVDHCRGWTLQLEVCTPLLQYVLEATPPFIVRGANSLVHSESSASARN